MLAKIYQLRFTNVDDARHAASYIADGMGGLVGELNIAGLTVLLRKEGTVQAIARFDNQVDFLRVQANRPKIVGEIQRRFPCIIEDIAAITVYSYEREAMATV
ncbi:MAG: hypothetical protein RIR62_2008 [Pseudomonadota bacterium]|jgi:hypothetical protein